MPSIRHFLALTIFASTAIAGEISHFDQAAVPPHCISTEGELTLSADHFKSGTQSLRWSWTSNKATFTITEPTPVAKPSPKAGFVTWAYNENPLKGKMTFKLLHQNKVVGSGWFWMNFRGWRILGAGYAQLGIPAGQAIDAIRFHAPESSSHGSIHLDMFQQDRDYAANRSPQTPWVDVPNGLLDPQRVVITAENPAVNRPWLPARKSSITEQERTEIQLLEQSLLTKRSAPGKGLASGKLDELRRYLSDWNIQHETTSVRGRPIDGGSPLIPEGFIPIGEYLKACEATKNAWYQAKEGPESDEVKKIYIALVTHLLDQGFTQGQRLAAFDNYPFGQYASFFAMKDVLVEAGLARPMAQALIDNFGSHGSGDFAKEHPSSTMDGLGYWNRELYSCALMFPEETEQFQHLQIAQRFLNLALVHPTTIAPDGSVYHHGGFHYAYASYNLPRLLQVLEKVAPTRFRIDAAAQERLKTYVHALAFTSSAGEQAYNLGMRAGTPLGTGGVEPVARMLANMGTPDGKEKIDAEMAAISLRLLAETAPNGQHPSFTKEPWKLWIDQGIKPTTVPDGFLVMNGAPLAIARRDSWLASIAGITPFYRCIEIYGWTQSNNYGRFARNGSLVITSQGKPSNLKDSGWAYDGWHWSHFPGTTALRVTSEVELFDGYAMYGNSQANVGGTALDDNGVWCVHHQGYGVSFQKSYFCFDNRITSITTGIRRTLSNNSWPAVTTLFQNAIQPTNENMLFDDGKRSTFPMEQTITFEKDRWLIDNKQTGYLIPAGSAPLRVTSRKQQWRYMIDKFLKDKTNNPFAKNVPNVNQGYQRARKTYKDLSVLEEFYTPSEGDFALAYLDHGNSTDPKAASGAAIYTAVIKTTPEQMKQLAAKPAWTILQANETAHIVHDHDRNTFAYSFFQSSDALPSSTPLRSCNQPCTVMIRRSGETLSCSLAYTVGSNAIPPEKIVDLNLVIDGDWQAPKNLSSATCINKDGKTTLTFRPTSNLPLTWQLQKK